MKKINLLVVAVLSALFLAACGSGSDSGNGKKYSSDDFSESMGEEIVEEMMGGETYVNIDYDADGGGEGILWPDNIPLEYPGFTGGKIDIVMGDFDVDNGVMLQFIEIGEKELEEYLKRLEESNWEIKRFEEGGMLLQVGATKESLEISIELDPIGSGTAFLYLGNF